MSVPIGAVSLHWNHPTKATAQKSLMKNFRKIWIEEKENRHWANCRWDLFRKEGSPRLKKMPGAIKINLLHKITLLRAGSENISVHSMNKLLKKLFAAWGNADTISFKMHFGSSWHLSGKGLLSSVHNKPSHSYTHHFYSSSASAKLKIIVPIVSASAPSTSFFR